MSGFIPNLRVSIDHPFDFYSSLVVVELEAILIDSGQAWAKAESTAKEGNET